MNRDSTSAPHHQAGQVHQTRQRGSGWRTVCRCNSLLFRSIVSQLSLLDLSFDLFQLACWRSSDDDDSNGALRSSCILSLLSLCSRAVFSSWQRSSHCAPDLRRCSCELAEPPRHQQFMANCVHKWRRARLGRLCEGRQHDVQVDRELTGVQQCDCVEHAGDRDVSHTRILAATA